VIELEARVELLIEKGAGTADDRQDEFTEVGESVVLRQFEIEISIIVEK